MARLTLVDPQAKAALAALKRSRGVSFGGRTADPKLLALQDASLRAVAAERKQIPITPAEKLRAFSLMGYEPTPKQLSITLDTHRIRSVRAGRRSGKALALDTPLPTPDGWTTMGDVCVGDSLFDEHGQLCMVTYTSPIFSDHDCFRLTFSDNSQIVADADHRWQVETKKVRKGGHLEMDYRHDPAGRPTWRRSHEPPVLTTREMFAHGVKNNPKENEYAVALADPIDTPGRLLPLDPYFLGVWLGDGHSYANRIYLDDADAEIIDEIRRRGITIERYARQKFAWVFYGLRGVLVSLTVWHNKHIPPMYLRASVPQRLDLLRGLVDTDGHVGVGGDVDITTMSPRLATDIKELAESLGCKVTVRTGRATLNGKDCGMKYRVAFSPTLPVAFLKRKAIRLNSSHQWQKRYITAIEPVPTVPTRCIQVDSPSHLFLAGNFIPTHNTTHAAHEAVAVMVMKPGSHGWVVAPDYQLAYRCWEIIVEELDKLAARGVVKYKLRRSAQDTMRIVLDNGSWVEGQSCEQAEDLQGVGLDWLIIDEVGVVLPFVFTEFLLPALSDRGGWAFLIGTPIGESWTEKEYRHQKRQEATTGVPTDWSEHLYETWHNTKIFKGGENDPEILRLKRNMSFEEYMEQVCAQPQKSKYVTYKEFDEDVHVRSCPFRPDHPVVLSVDPSTGANPYAVVVAQDFGDTVYQIDEYYRTSVMAEEVIEDLSGRPWWGNVEDIIMDDAWPQEIRRWREHPRLADTNGAGVTKAGKTAYIVDSLPVVRQWLRDPVRYSEAVLPIRDALIAARYPGQSWATLEVDDQKMIALDTEVEANKDKDLLWDCARLFVDRRCLNTIDEFSGYMYKRRKREDQNVNETPTDHKNHCLIGDTLVTMATGPVRLDQLTVGTPILTRYGFQPLVARWRVSDAAAVFRLTCDDGTSLVGTADHPIWIEGRGFTEIAQVRYNDCVLIFDGEAQSWHEPGRNPSFSRELASDATPTRGTSRPASITDQPRECVGSRTYTARCGSSRTAPSPPATTCTMPTTTACTTRSTISSASPSPSTCDCIRTDSVATAGAPTLTRSAPWRPVGTAPTTGGRGMPSTAETFGDDGCRWLATAQPAAVLSSRRPGVPAIVSARTLANPHGDDDPVSMTRRACARYVALRSRAASTFAAPRVPVRAARVIAIDRLPPAPVYDLTVDVHHELFANGILVGQCMDGWRYLLFKRKRRWGSGRIEPYSYVSAAAG